MKRCIRASVRGKDEVIDLALTAVLAGGHLLVEDVPGVGKTTLAASLAHALGGSFSRIQFTSDLLPGDITGVNILDPASGAFSFRQGPLFANVVLADEINRTTPKTQSALLEAMEEHAVTVDGKTRRLPDPFFVIATQNPYDYDGAFPLPDSQLDRFLMRLSMGYPDRDTERQILRRGGRSRTTPERAVQIEQVRELVSSASEVQVSPRVEEYLLDIVRATRSDARLVRGVSPRGAQALYRAVCAAALVRGRGFAVPEDVRDLAPPVLGHRVVTRSGARLSDEGTRVIGMLVDEMAPPA